MRGILTEASFQPYTGPGRIINWTIASPDAERGSPRVLASVEGELPLELKAPEFPADIGQTVQHVIMLKDAAYDLEARYLDAEVTMEVEVHGDLRVERVREIRSIDYSGETGLCAFFVDPECYSLPGQDAGEPPVQGIAKNLTATLTWDAQWPTTEELTLAVTSRIDGSPSGPDAFRRWNGTSPLQVEVPGEFFRGPEGTLAFTVYGYRESLHPNVAGLGEFTALPQDFTLTASFEDWVYPSNGTRGDRWID